MRKPSCSLIEPLTCDDTCRTPDVVSVVTGFARGFRGPAGGARRARGTGPPPGAIGGERARGGRASGYLLMYPPSAWIVVPWMKDEASEASHRLAWAISRAWPKRPIVVSCSA